MRPRVELFRLRFNGTRVRFKVYTPADGNVLRRAAFVTSPIGDAESWDALCRILAGQGCLCVAFELPGFGHTPVDAPQDNATRSAILWGVLDEVETSRGDPPSKWHLVSHGSGCAVILEMTRTQPDGVASRTLISPVTHRFTTSLSRSFVSGRLGRWLYTKAYEYRAGSIKRFGAKLYKLYGERLTDERVYNLHREFYREGRTETLFELFAKGYRLPEKAYRVAAPIMLIWGKNDPFGPRPDERLLKSLPDTEVHYITSAHMSMETMPQEISEYLKGWFEFAEGRMKTPHKQKRQY